jgi:UDP-N-acetylmuramoylalanine-D-glutamate ligase
MNLTPQSTPNIMQVINTEYDHLHHHNIFTGYIQNKLHFILFVTDEFITLTAHDKRNILSRVWAGLPCTAIVLTSAKHKPVAAIDCHLVHIFDQTQKHTTTYTNTYKRTF